MLTSQVLQSSFKSPYPYFGGKSSIAPDVWSRLGSDVTNFVDPFFGSNAMLLARPGWTETSTFVETVNDKSALIANFWRAVTADPEAVAYYADYPCNENDLHARHIWLVARKEELREHIEGDPDYFDAKIAGWWVWGMANWLGRGWCSGKGPWSVVDGKLVKGEAGDGVTRKRLSLINTGRGVSRQSVHLGITRQLPHFGNKGQGVGRVNAYIGATNGNCSRPGTGECGIYAWFDALQARMRRVRVASGDWKRVLTPTPTTNIGTTAVFLDPPYAAETDRDNDLYEHEDLAIAWDVRDWAIANGDNLQFRIAVCGYDASGYTFPSSWERLSWSTNGGMGNQSQGRGRDNADREVIWFSPHCIKPQQDSWVSLSLFHHAEQNELTFS